ncbi:MAG: hypothetical protein GX567_15280 [Clostridia bacterium]|nr:hypothetical protein [Clostridia bacterium]
MKKMKSNTLSDVPGRSPRIKTMQTNAVRSLAAPFLKGDYHYGYGENQGSDRS